MNNCSLSTPDGAPAVRLPDAGFGGGGPPGFTRSAGDWYIGTKLPRYIAVQDSPVVTRVQTGVRLEARTLNVLKALAALKGMSLGDLLEGIVLHAFDGEQAFSDATREQIAGLKKIYGLELNARDSHTLIEAESGQRPAIARRSGSSKSTRDRRTKR